MGEWRRDPSKPLLFFSLSNFNAQQLLCYSQGCPWLLEHPSCQSWDNLLSPFRDIFFCMGRWSVKTLLVRSLKMLPNRPLPSYQASAITHRFATWVVSFKICIIPSASCLKLLKRKTIFLTNILLVHFISTPAHQTEPGRRLSEAHKFGYDGTGQPLFLVPSLWYAVPECGGGQKASPSLHSA